MKLDVLEVSSVLIAKMVYTLGFFFQNKNVNRLVFARIKSQIKKPK